MNLLLFLILFLLCGALLGMATIGMGFTLLYGVLRMLGNKEPLTPKKMYNILMGV